MRAARTVGWAWAALLVLGGHAGAALWVMSARPEPPPPAGQPIFVDLAPPPPAPDFDVPESGLSLSGPVTGLPTPPPPDVEAPPSASEPAEPQSELADPLPPQIGLPPIEPLPRLDAAALLPPSVPAERPAPRPERIKRPRAPDPETPRAPLTTETRQPSQTPAAQPAARTRAPASAASPRAAAQASGAGKGAGAKAQASWRATASAVVARHMQRGRYNTRQPVSASISLTVDGAGRITGAAVTSAGGTLDAALTRQIRRLGRLPAPPGGRGLSVVVPVRIAR